MTKLTFSKLMIIAVLKDEQGNEYAAETDDAAHLLKMLQRKAPSSEPKVRQQRGPTVTQWHVMDYLKLKPNGAVFLSEATLDLSRKYPERTTKDWTTTINHMVQHGMLQSNGMRGTKRVVYLARESAQQPKTNGAQAHA